MFAPPKLTMTGVLKEFRAIATSSGSNSVDKKKGLIKKLLVGARECEVGRCRLTVSKPVLKAPMVSALGATI